MISTNFQIGEFNEREDGERAYLPSPEEIAAMCAEFRKTWSERETRRRNANTTKLWSVPTVSAVIDLKHIAQ